MIVVKMPAKVIPVQSIPVVQSIPAFVPGMKLSVVDKIVPAKRLTLKGQLVVLRFWLSKAKVG